MTTAIQQIFLGILPNAINGYQYGKKEIFDGWTHESCGQFLVLHGRPHQFDGYHRVHGVQGTPWLQPVLCNHWESLGIFSPVSKKGCAPKVRRRYADLEDGSDESEFPRFIQKYIEYGTLERAYSANTDGKIESLGDYWALRRKMGLEAIKRFKGKRKTDRDYRLITKGEPTGRRHRKEPRLPDTYPAVYVRTWPES